MASQYLSRLSNVAVIIEQIMSRSISNLEVYILCLSKHIIYFCSDVHIASCEPRITLKSYNILQRASKVYIYVGHASTARHPSDMICWPVSIIFPFPYILQLQILFLISLFQYLILLTHS